MYASHDGLLNPDCCRYFKSGTWYNLTQRICGVHKLKQSQIHDFICMVILNHTYAIKELCWSFNFASPHGFAMKWSDAILHFTLVFQHFTFLFFVNNVDTTCKSGWKADAAEEIHFSYHQEQIEPYSVRLHTASTWLRHTFDPRVNESQKSSNFLTSYQAVFVFNHNLQSDLDNFIEWCECSGLPINREKCRIFDIVTRKDFTSHRSCNIWWCDYQTVHYLSFLGLTFSSDMRWNLHFDFVYKKAMRRVFVIQSLRRNDCPPALMIKVYNQRYSILYF